MTDLTLTLLRLGLLALLWIFIFSVVGVLRTDIYGTSVSHRSHRKAQRQQDRQLEQDRRATAQPAPAPAPAAARGGRFGRGRGGRVPTTLVVTEGPLAGTSLTLRGAGILIGRNPECALVLDDDYASGRHCRIYQDPAGRDGWMVEDLGSTNGTFIGRDANSRDKLTAPRPVEVGTTLRIGKTVLEFRG